MRKANLISGVLFFLLSMFFLYYSNQLPKEVPGSGLGPGVLPYWLALFLGTLASLLFFINLFNPSTEQLVISRDELTGAGLVFVTLAIYVFSINYLGFALGTVLFVTFLSNLLGKYAWSICVVFGATVAVMCVQIFKTFLSMPLPTGILGI